MVRVTDTTSKAYLVEYLHILLDPRDGQCGETGHLRFHGELYAEVGSREVGTMQSSHFLCHIIHRFLGVDAET
jgi:hypothetical protein